MLSKGIPLTFILAIVLLAGCATTPRQDINWQDDDFSWVRGVNYVPSYARNDVDIWHYFDAEVIDRELGYAESIGINSVRVFLQIICYEDNPALFLERLDTFLTLCEKHHITMMPVLFDSCFGVPPSFEAKSWVQNPGNDVVAQDAWPRCEQYIEDVVGAHIGDPRIAIWDVMNEPEINGGFSATPENDKKLWRFVRHFVERVNELDPTHPTTVGVAGVNNAERVADVETLISFHGYTGDEEQYASLIDMGKALGAKHGKPVVISEMAHYAKGMSYEMSIRVPEDKGIGFYFWELMIGNSPFPRFTGIFYPDGTIRSASDLAAVQGFRKAGLSDQVYPLQLLSKDELNSLITEALSTPSAPWNIERRLNLLYSYSFLDGVARVGFLRAHPEITAADFEVLLEEQPQLVAQFFLETSGMQASLDRELAEAYQAFRNGDAAPLRIEVDQRIAEYGPEILALP